jgi:meso-butanediol dehydrogenase/(S,S)-butanediol dehydrogenase/diacetyl reductase
MGQRRFANKVVIVTGAGSGIGAAMAERFSHEGACLSLSDIDLNALQRVVKKAKLPARRTLLTAVDAGLAVDVERQVAETIARFGKLDVLLNNVGIATFGFIDDCTEERWRRVQDVTLGSAFFSVKAALPYLRKSKGNVVFTASITGLRGDSGLAVYSSAKAGVANFCRSLAIDHAPDGIRFNAVCPGVTFTPRTQWMADSKVVANEIKARVPMGRMGLPHEMAAAAAFLASDDASYITGVNLPVDGGATAGSGLPFFKRLLPDRKK